MRWGVFLLFTLVAVALDTSLLSVFAIGDTVPQLSPLLAAFVCLGAPRLTAMWACLVLGLVIDLCSPVVDPQLRAAHLVGPHALGYLFAANLILPLRTMVFRRNPLTLGVLAGLFSFATALVVVAIWSLRMWYPDAPVVFGGRSALTELGRAGLGAIYCGVLSIPVGWLLVRTAPLWRFRDAGARGRR